MPNGAHNITTPNSIQASDDLSSTPDYVEEFPRARVEPLPLWCTATYGSHCSRCVSVCPTGAISVNEEGPEIDEDKCTRCGLCAGICDAFAFANITLSDLLARTIRGWKNEGSVCFTCNEHLLPGLQPRNNVIVVPCLGSIPPEFWAAVMAEGIEIGIFRDSTYCETCTVAGDLGAGLFGYALDTACQWCESSVVKCKSIPEKVDFLTSLARIDTGDRRELFSSLKNESLEVASGKHRKRQSNTTDEYFRKRDIMRAEGRIRAGRASRRATPGQNVSLRKYPRQKLLIEAVQKRPDIAPNIPRYFSCTHEEKCCKEKACLAACPTHCRTLPEIAPAPRVNPTGCIACGACIAACPHDACDFYETTAEIFIKD